MHSNFSVSNHAIAKQMVQAAIEMSDNESTSREKAALALKVAKVMALLAVADEIVGLNRQLQVMDRTFGSAIQDGKIQFGPLEVVLAQGDDESFHVTVMNDDEL